MRDRTSSNGSAPADFRLQVERSGNVACDSSKYSSLSRILLLLVLLLSSVAACLPALAQAPNQRLILKDGTYQVVTKYQKVGDRVRYFSAERGQWEELPADLVDWAATEQWAKDHAPGRRPPRGACRAGHSGSGRDR